MSTRHAIMSGLAAMACLLALDSYRDDREPTGSPATTHEFAYVRRLIQARNGDHVAARERAVLEARDVDARCEVTLPSLGIAPILPIGLELLARQRDDHRVGHRQSDPLLDVPRADRTAPPASLLLSALNRQGVSGESWGFSSATW